MSFHFLSFSFIFFHFLSFSLLGGQNLIFFWASISLRFLLPVLMKNQFLGPSRVAGISGGTPLGPLFFFSYFFSHFLSFFMFLCSFLHFFIFLMFFIFFFQKKKFVLFFLLVFLSNMFYCWHQYQSLTVSSVVGAPWRCRVFTT